MRHGLTALALIVIGMLKHFSWQFSWLDDIEVQGQVWNIGAAVMGAFVLWLLGSVYQSRAMWLACGVLIGCEAVLAGCSVAWLVSPWETTPGDYCSAKLNVPLGVAGAVAFLAVVLSIIKGQQK